MVTGVIDTSIVIDLLHGYIPAVEWQKNRIDEVYALTTIVKMEVIEGASNRRELELTLKFLRKFPIIETTQADLDWAFDQFVTYYLSHGVDIEDCLIASPCHRLKLTLYTRNLKHFTPLLGTLAQVPY